MEIIRARHSGFCFGVRRAIKITFDQVKNNRDGRKIFTAGQLIHNPVVTAELEDMGVHSIRQPEECPKNSDIIIRSHGETEDFFQRAASQGCHLVDATCPYVTKIHMLVHRAYQEEKNIVIIGDYTHPEVIGINGWCQNKAYIISSRTDAENYPFPSAFIVCQTTLRENILKETVRILQEKNVDTEVMNTICSATRERQDAAAKLAHEVDAMVVIGGRNSSNTHKLYEICKNICKTTWFVENNRDLPLRDLKKYNKIGVAAGASTPERVIKEVISNMSDNITNETNSMADFMDEIDASLKLPRTGQIITGKVDQVTDDAVIVNMGCKKDGILNKDEVSLEEGQTLSDKFSVGDEVEAKVIRTDDSDGGIMLSLKKLEVNKHWKELSDAMEEGRNIDVDVVRVVKGGVIAQYKEVSGFIPLSQLSNHYVEDANEFLNQTLTVKVTRVDMRRGRAVFSHKNVLQEERQKQLDQIWETLQVDDIVEGTVMRFTDYGAFVDLGGIDGLLHISEISWGKLKHPSEVLKIGQKINVKILSMNREKGKISLGYKQTLPEPWSVINDNYHVDEVVRGKVVQLKEYGAFVELEPGLDGLVHISQVANKHVNNISDELEIGQMVNARILDIDTDRRRISLSIKEAIGEEPENVPAEEVPVEPEAEVPAAEEAPVEPEAEETPENDAE